MFYVWVYNPSDPDLNYITTAQVEQVESKYWNVYAWLNDDTDWSPYAGMLYEIGDVNDDGQIKISDVTALINYLMSGDASGINLGAADCNGDGQVKISDVTALISYLMNGTWLNKAPAMNAQDHTVRQNGIHRRDLPDMTRLELEPPVKKRGK